MFERHRIIGVVLGMLASGASAANARAEERTLIVHASVLVAPALRELAPAFERATGIKVQATYGLASTVAAGVRAGQPCDVALGPQAAMKQLATDGLVKADPAVVAKSGIGVEVRKGAAKPDLATVEAFKKALSAAPSLGYTDPALGGASGVYVTGLIDRLGLSADLKAKTHLAKSGGDLNALVVKGDVAVGLLTVSEILANPAVELAAPLPQEIQSVTVIAAAIVSKSPSVDEAQQFVAYLRTPPAMAVFAAKGTGPAD